MTNQYRTHYYDVPDVVKFFEQLSYDAQAHAYRKIVKIFERSMERQNIDQHVDKIAKIVQETLEDGTLKLTNVHGNVYFAVYDLKGFDDYGVDGYFFWGDDLPTLKMYLQGDLDVVKHRICNL